MIIEGRLITAIITVIFFILTILYVDRSKRQLPWIRPIAGLNAIDEVIGRSVEMGRPVHYTIGGSGVEPANIAGLTVLGHVARISARLGAKLIFTCGVPEVIPLAESHMEAAYRLENRTDMVPDVRYFAGGYVQGVTGLINQENIAAQFIIGAIYYYSIVFAEIAYKVGAMQIAGTPNYWQLPFFVAICDYTLIGEEVYVAGAYLSKDPVQMGSILSSDVAKILSIILIILGVIALIGGSDLIITLISY